MTPFAINSPAIFLVHGGKGCSPCSGCGQTYSTAEDFSWEALLYDLWRWLDEYSQWGE